MPVLVSERLTELGIDFVAKQVAPRQADRDGGHEIPLLVTEDGERFEGTDAVFGYLAGLSGAVTRAGTARNGARTARTARSLGQVAGHAGIVPEVG